MPYKPESRREAYKKSRSKLLADPQALQKHLQERRNYYAAHKAAYAKYGKKYKESVLKDPKKLAVRRAVQRKHYYAKRSQNPEWNNWHTEYAKRYRAKLKKQILDAYGPICSCCGETIPEFLTPDHINGGGGKHLKKRGVQGIYLDIIREGFPKDKYQILCMNCNWGKSVYGACPHHGHTNKK